MSEMPTPKSFYPPPGTTKVKRRDFMQCINKSWFHDLIKNRLCVIQLESSTTSKIGKIEDILLKSSSYQLFGKPRKCERQSLYHIEYMILFLDSGYNLNKKTNRWLEVVIQDQLQEVQELKFNEIAYVFILER